MKNKKFSKMVVVSIIILNILYTIGALYVFKCTGQEPVTLTGCWFAFTTGELWMLTGIKKKEINSVAKNT